MRRSPRQLPFSSNYRNLKTRVNNTRPTIKVYDSVRDERITRISLQRARYCDAARTFRQDLVTSQNRRIVSRLTQMKGTYTSLAMNHSLSLQSSSVSSNARRRFIKAGEIARENLKIAKRLQEPKGVKDFKKEFNWIDQKEKNYLQVRRQMANRNQQIIATLGLKQKNRVRGLPKINN